MLKTMNEFFWEQGYRLFAVASDLHSQAFVKEETASINVICVLNALQPGSPIAQKLENFENMIQSIYAQHGHTNVHILMLLVGNDSQEMRVVAMQRFNCWYYNVSRGCIEIGVNQMPDFYGMKGLLCAHIGGNGISFQQTQTLIPSMTPYPNAQMPQGYYISALVSHPGFQSVPMQGGSPYQPGMPMQSGSPYQPGMPMQGGYQPRMPIQVGYPGSVNTYQYQPKPVKQPDRFSYDMSAPVDKEPFVFPWVTAALIVINVIIFIFTLFMSDDTLEALVLDDSFTYDASQWYRLITYAFLHAGIDHIFGNMSVLYVTGSLAERYLGRCKFLILYFICAIVSGGGSILFYRLITDDYTTVGASGAILGVIGALAILLIKTGIQPNGKFPIWRLILVIVFLIYINFPSGEGNVNYVCHIIGVATGAIITLIYIGLGLKCGPTKRSS